MPTKKSRAKPPARATSTSKGRSASDKAVGTTVAAPPIPPQVPRSSLTMRPIKKRWRRRCLSTRLRRRSTTHPPVHRLPKARTIPCLHRPRGWHPKREE